MEYEVRATNLDDLDNFTRAYLECAEWCGIDDEERERFEAIDDPRWSRAALKQAREDCQGFRMLARDLLAEWSDEQAGHDFWLTRNRHGAGFWDRGKQHGDALTKIAHTFGESYVTLNRKRLEVS